MLSIKLPSDLETRLNRLAAATHRPKSFYLRAALQEYLEAHEETYLALARLETPAKRWRLDELEENLDVER